MILKRLSLTLLLVTLTQAEMKKWKTDRQPKVSHKKLSLQMLSTENVKVRKLIVDIHNHYRASVTPPAANMLQMSWDNSAMEDAVRWSKACQVLTHDNATGRWVHGFGSCGQNIFISTHLVPWLFAIKTWWLEKDLFNYGENVDNDLIKIGHYTQLVWAPTHKVGCGLERCQMNEINSKGLKTGKMKDYYLYVCNYCPIGNFQDRLGTPYKAGPSCSGCKGECSTSRKYNKVKAKRRNKHLLKKRLRHRRLRRKFQPNSKSKMRPRQSKSPKKQLKLCRNACPVADLWINCRELYSEWKEWLCQERTTPEGRERFRSCQATCICHGKITN